MKNKIVSIMLVFALILTFAGTGYAAESAAKVVQIKVGSTQMKVNGKAQKITAPYATKESTMIPMPVFTKGMGAKLALKNNKVITLTIPKYTVVLTVGSKAATVNGKKTTLPSAPAVKNGVTFAPLKVAESLGAKVKTDAKTKEISITMASTAADPGAGSGKTPGSGANSGSGTIIDSDAGKSRIGDSYHQWSMNYPTGLVQEYQSDNGDLLIFRDVKQEYFVGIFVEEAVDALSTEEKRNVLLEYIPLSDTVMDKRTVTASAASYEKMTTKDKGGFFYEYRGIQSNGRMYVIVFGKKAANAAELAPYLGVLDSFQTSFDAGDAKLKDLAKIKAGFKIFKNEDYGFSVSLPKEWTANTKVSYPSYKTEDAYMWVEVTSTVGSDTAEAWAARKIKRFEEAFAPAYRKVLDQREVVWNGVPARVVKISYSYDTKLWWEEYEMFAIKGKYRYYFEYGYKESAKSTYDAMYDSVRNSLSIDYAVVEKNFGEITDDSDLADRTSLVTKTSRKYGYSVQVPEHWTAVKKDFELDEVQYAFAGGTFSVLVVEDVPFAADFHQFIDGYFQKLTSETAGLRITENTMVSFAGTTAKKVVIEESSSIEASPSRAFFYYVHKDGKMYMVAGEYFLAHGSDFVVGQLEAAMNSFKFQ